MKIGEVSRNGVGDRIQLGLRDEAQLLVFDVFYPTIIDGKYAYIIKWNG